MFWNVHLKADIRLSSDSSSSYSVAGVLRFRRQNSVQNNYARRFWQLSLKECETILPMLTFDGVNVIINFAGFLAALITYVTFSQFCYGKMTTLKIDNVSIKVWSDSSRPRHPFELCAQSIYIVKR